MEKNMNDMSKAKKSKVDLAYKVILAFVVIIVAVWFLRSSEQDSLTIETQVPDKTTSALLIQGTSTDLADIQKDIQANDLSGLDEGVIEISISL